MKKRIISLLVLCCLALILLPGMALNAEAASYVSGDWTYEVNSGLATITRYTGTASTVNIPTTIGNYQVTTIGEYAFDGKATVNTVVFPNSITRIEAFAFRGCVGLTSITLPERLAYLGGKAFENCTNVTKITINCRALSDIDNIYGINGQPFLGVGTATNGVEVVFGSNCTKIPAELFFARAGAAYCANITSVTLADSVQSVGHNAFTGCVYLKTVKLGNGVTSIHNYAFDGCAGLESITFSNALIDICEGAFRGCASLKAANFPVSLINIYNYAFEGCVNLTQITLPQKLAYLGERAFQNCTKVSRITIKCKSLGNIGNSYGINGQPFYCAGTATDGIAVEFADGCTYVPANLFYARSGEAYAPYITSVTMADSVQTIGESAFKNVVELKTVNMGNGVTEVGNCAFEYCANLTNVTYSDALRTIGYNAFSVCASLKNPELPVTLTSIGNHAYNGCLAITSVTLPENLATLGERCFMNCTKLSKLVINSKYIADIASSWDFRGQPFYCAGTATDGIAVTFAQGCTRVPGNIFYAHSGDSYAPNIKSVTMAATVTEIGGHAFRNCPTIKNLVLSEKITAIGDWAFANCSGLESVKFTGEAPMMYGNLFSGTTTIAYYPTGFDTWTADKLQNYGGTVTWKSFLGRLANVTIYNTNPHATGNILYWNEVEYGDVYQVYRLSPGATSWELITNTRSLAYKDTSAVGGVKYYYKIVARNGNVKSNIATTTSVAVTRPVTNTLPNVKMIGVTPHSTGNIVKWNAVSGAKLYQVYRLKSGSTSWELLTNTGSLAYKDQMAPVGVRCYYKCVARNGDAKSDIATTDSVYGARLSPTSLNNVEMISAQGHSTGIIVKWNPVGGAQLYQVYRLKSGSSSWELITNTGSTAYKDTSAVSGVRYYYKVVARYGSIKSGMNIDSVSAVRP